MVVKFDTIFLEEASDFLDDLDEKPRDKVLYNIWKSTQVTDNELFKKLQGAAAHRRNLGVQNFVPKDLLPTICVLGQGK